MTISTELFQIAGLFWRYRETGGSFNAEESASLAARLGMLAEGAAQQEAATRSISEEFDRYIADQAGDAPRIPAREIASLTLIEGGRC